MMSQLGFVCSLQLDEIISDEKQNVEKKESKGILTLEVHLLIFQKNQLAVFCTE